MAAFFNPVSEFGYTEGEIQSGETNLVKVRFTSPDGAGGYLPCATTAYQPKTVRREVFHIHKAANGTFGIPSVGAVVNGWHLNAVKVDYACETWPTVTIEGHRHGEAEHPATDSGYTFGPSLTFPTGYGIVPNWCGDGGRSATYKLECRHSELTDENNEVVQSDTFGGIETFTGETTGEAIPPNTDWVATGAAANAVIDGIHYHSKEFTHSLQAEPAA